MLDIGQQQLLVLLLVVQAEADELAKLCLGWPVAMRCSPCYRIEHALVHLCPVAEHILQRRAADQPTLGPWIFIPYRVVIAVEKHPETRIERAEDRLETLEDKGFEKPGEMRQMPLCGACIGH